MLGNKKWLSILLVATLATFGFGMAAGADSASESSFVAKINASRASAGLPALTVDGGLRSGARTHTGHMMDAGKIFHSDSAELKAAGSSGWTKLGENVGMGGDVSSLHNAFMNSSGHRANILGDYNYVGVGTGTKDGVLYVTVMFMKLGSTAPPTTQAPTTTTAAAATPTTAAAAKPKPAPTTTITTIPSTTTTSLVVGPDKPVTPGNLCLDATRFWWTCHD